MKLHWFVLGSLVSAAFSVILAAESRTITRNLGSLGEEMKLSRKLDDLQEEEVHTPMCAETTTATSASLEFRAGNVYHLTLVPPRSAIQTCRRNLQPVVAARIRLSWGRFDGIEIARRGQAPRSREGYG